MEPRLLPVNAVLGLLTPHDVNPAVLIDAGFTLEGLEVPVAGDEGNVIIDVLCFSPTTGLLIAFESKSGANIEPKQARSYAVLTAEAIVRASQISVPQRMPLTKIIVYTCLDQYRDRIRLGLTEAGVDFPILAVGSEITLSAPSKVPQELADSFAVPVRLNGPPPRIIAFDPDSPVDAVVPVVRAQLVAALSHERLQVSVPWLTEECARHYSLYGRAARRRFIKLFEDTARQVCGEDPSAFAFLPPRGNDGDAAVKLLKTPEHLDRRGRTQAYQALARAGLPRRRRRAEAPGQLDLLRELDEEDNESSDEADGEATS